MHTLELSYVQEVLREIPKLFRNLLLVGKHLSAYTSADDFLPQDSQGAGPVRGTG